MLFLRLASKIYIFLIEKMSIVRKRMCVLMWKYWYLLAGSCAFIIIRETKLKIIYIRLIFVYNTIIRRMTYVCTFVSVQLVYMRCKLLPAAWRYLCIPICIYVRLRLQSWNTMYVCTDARAYARIYKFDKFVFL